MNDTRKRRRGPEPLAPTEKRGHCVSVRLNIAELATLDKLRGPYQRGEWLRMAALDRLPPVIPEINRSAWVELARTVANLNQIARAINEGRAEGVPASVLDGLREHVQALRAGIIGVKVDAE